MAEPVSDIRTDDAPPDALTKLREEGYVILRELIPSEQVEAIRAELEPHFGPFGRNPFEGEKTQRCYALLAKAPSIAALVEHPAVLALVDQFLSPSYLLWGALAVNLHPGETRQDYHCDDDAGAPPRPRVAQGISSMWAIDDFTEENGATELIPRSHLAGPGDVPNADDARSVTAIMPAGSVLVWQGPLYHRGGANRSKRKRLGITLQYCQPWLRQIENMTLAVSPRAAAQYSNRVRQMLGYGLMNRSFMGYVDGRDPRKLVEAHDNDESDATPDAS